MSECEREVGTPTAGGGSIGFADERGAGFARPSVGRGGIASEASRLPHRIVGDASPCKERSDLVSECEREGEAPLALPMEGATRAPVIDESVV